ncbi:MAG: hypothetical protein NTY35_08925 [Planctomycetota bacterium]|nr:hypothetical protein [Planctomycetota bacterium]
MHVHRVSAFFAFLFALSTPRAAAQTTFDDVHPVFRKYCADCHSTQGNGAFDIANGDIHAAYADSQLPSYFASGQTKGFASLLRIQNGDMPLGAGCTGNPVLDAGNPPCLGAVEQARIQAWIQDGQRPPRPTTGTPYCFGDGSGTLCPCGNTGASDGGCANTVSFSGAKLVAAGAASLAADTLVLRGTRMPNSSALYFQGTTALAGGLGAVFGDGLRCAGGSVQRLGTQTNAAGASQFPEGLDPSISVRGAVTVPATRTYQVWYRNAAAFCQPETFNLTNGVSLTWTP